MGVASIVTLARLALALLNLLGWGNNLAERRAGAAERDVASEAEITKRENEGAAIDAEIAAMTDAALDQQLEGKTP